MLIWLPGPGMNAFTHLANQVLCASQLEICRHHFHLAWQTAGWEWLSRTTSSNVFDCWKCDESEKLASDLLDASVVTDVVSLGRRKWIEKEYLQERSTLSECLTDSCAGVRDYWAMPNQNKRFLNLEMGGGGYKKIKWGYLKNKSEIEME